MNKSYSHIIHTIYNTPWLITEEGLDTILAIVDRKMTGEELSFEQLAEMRDKNEERGRLQIPEKPGIAVIPIHGSIFPKANLLTDFSGGTSMEKFINDFNMLMEADTVKGILLDIDSPGGNAIMIKEGADLIFEGRQKKPVWASANAVSASGAYYLGSQANKFFGTPSATLGSIGVIAVHTDETEKDKMEGVKRTVLTVGENKGIGHPALPLTDAHVQIKLEEMTEVYDEFVSDVARGRGVTADVVKETYGKGRTYKSRSALEKGMIDGIKTIKSVSEEFLSEVFLNTSKPVSVPRQVGAKMAEITPEILESLELSEDATPEDVLTAIQGIRETTPEPAVTEPTTQITPEFEKAYPELAARIKANETEMAEMRAGRRKDAAKMFAADYEKFSTEDGSETGLGFSGLALTQVEEMHLKIADGLMTHDDLSSLLDNVASGNAIVDYREHGSTRGKEPIADGSAAATELTNKAKAYQLEKGESYGDSLAAVMADPENAELVAAYRSAYRPAHQGGDE